jgi:hypothetical protein
MATVNKDFKVKNGLIVEGTTAKVNNFDILTKKQADQDYIVSLIGGTATSANTADTVVKRDGSGNFAAGTITANITGNVTGNVTGTVSDISNHNTDDLTEGTSNKYFTTGRIDDHLSGGDGISYSSGTISADLGVGLEITSGQIVVDRTTVDAWYDANGAAGQALTDAQNYADDQIQDGQTTSTTTWSSYKTSTEIGLAQTAAQDYADGLINDASTASDEVWSSYKTSTEIGLAQAAAELHADGVAGDVQDDLDAHTNATSGVHGVTGDVVGTTDAQTISNKTLGSDLAAGGYKVSGLADPTADQDSATKAYVDGAISALVDSAPELLDTLNELAAAINDDASFATTIGNSIGEKVAKAGDSMTGNLDFGGTSKVTSLATPTSSGDAATKGYVDGRETAITTAYQTYADQAETDAKAYTDTREGIITTAYQNYANQAETDAVATANGYTDGEITTALSTAQGYANTAEQNAKDYADALDTDDVAEGTGNLYFTNQRAIDAVGGTIGDAIDELNTDDIEEGSTNLYHTSSRAKSAAAELLVGATKTNIQITGTGAGLTITAENGVADSTTTDLAEGTNLYFTNARAVTALEAVVPNFTEVDINSLATQVAATVSVPTASSNNVAYSFAKADYRSAEFFVKTAYSTHTEISKVLLTLDTSDNIAITEYGTIGTNGAAMTISADIDGSNVRLLVTTANNTSTITVVGTLLK